MSAGKTASWVGIINRSIFLIIILMLFFGGLESILGLAGIRPLATAEDPLVCFAGGSPLFVKKAAPSSETIMKTANNKLKFFNDQEFPFKSKPAPIASSAWAAQPRSAGLTATVPLFAVG